MQRGQNLDWQKSKILPLTASITLVLDIDPSELLATHWYKNTPPLEYVLFQIPTAFVSEIAVLFSNSWYKFTPGLALAEHVKLTTSPLQALFFIADVASSTFSGLTMKKQKKKKNSHKVLQNAFVHRV